MNKEIKENSVKNIFIIIKNAIQGKEIRNLYHFSSYKRKYSSLKKNINNNSDRKIFHYSKIKKTPMTSKNNISYDEDLFSKSKIKDNKKKFITTNSKKSISYSNKFKARPCPSFNFMEVKKSNKPLTIGHEPNLHTKKRFYERQRKKSKDLN